MKKNVVILTVFIILGCIRFSMAADDKVKLPPGYTPPFEYEARPLLEKHTNQIDSLSKDISSLKNEIKKMKDSGASSQKQGTEFNAKIAFDKLARDINLLKSEVASLKNELGMIKQSAATPSVPASSSENIAGDTKIKGGAQERDMNNLQEKNSKD